MPINKGSALLIREHAIVDLRAKGVTLRLFKAKRYHGDKPARTVGIDFTPS
jgi:hypothetical protein